ncbi:MAG: hypothetical protein ACR2J9_07745, partial [Gaiellales bacterium]
MPATRPRPSTRELLGGRWAVSLRVYLIGSAFVLVMPLLSFRVLFHATPGGLAVLILVQWVAASIVYVAARSLVFRHTRTTPVGLPWVIAFVLLLGVARVAAAIALERVSGGAILAATDRLTLVFAMVPSTIIFVLLPTYLVAIEDWYSSERARLTQFDIDAEAARLRALGALDATRAITTARIREEIEEHLAALDPARAADERLRLSGTVLETAAGYVRPTSHALWGAPAPRHRRTALRELERLALREPLPALLPWLLWLACTLPFSMVRNGLWQTATASLALLTGMAICYPIGSRTIRRFAPAPRDGTARLLAIVATALATVPLFVVHNRSANGTGATFIAACVIVLAATAGVALVRAALRLQGERLGELRTQAEEAEFQRLALEAATEQMQRDLARYLHGTVQAGLVAAAYAIQDAATRGDEVALERAIADARAAAARISEHAPPAPSANLDAKRDEIDETWQGMLALTWSLPAESLDVATVERIGNVVQECLANASIHG